MQPTHLLLDEAVDDSSNFGAAANSSGDRGSSGENKASHGSNGACSVEDVGRGGDKSLLLGAVAFGEIPDIKMR